MSHGTLIEALRASYAILGVVRPVHFDGRWLFDGAVVNLIPVTVCLAMGAQCVIAVNLNADLFGLGTVLVDVKASADEAEESNEKPTPAGNGWGARKLLQRQIFGRGLFDKQAAPSISTVVVDAFNIVHDSIALWRLARDPHAS